MNNRNKGQLLLEVLIALTILGLVAVAVVKVSTRSLKSSRVSGNKKEALDLAEQVLLDVEKEKIADIGLFFSGPNGDVDCSNSNYVCTVSYVFDSPPDSSSVEVSVVVTWEEGGTNSSVSLNKVFTKTRL